MYKFSASVASVAALASSTATANEAAELQDYRFHDFFHFDSFESILKPLECTACGKAVSWFDTIFDNKKFVDYSFDAVSALCFVAGKFEPRFSCRQLVVQFGRPFVDVLQNHLLTRQRICDEILGVCNRPHITEIAVEDAVAEILENKPEAIQDDNFINNLYAEIAADTNERKTLNAIQITDVHLDFEYEIGTLENCNSYGGCCRTGVGYPPAGELGAQKWGSLYCDLPMVTFRHMLNFITNELKPDIVFWTGDNTAHNVWDNTADETTIYTITVTNMMKQAFKNSNITVLPIQGNHDTWVEEMQDFDAPGINYEINQFMEYWDEWLDEEAMTQFKKYGYYSMDMKLQNGKDLPQGSKVIAINTQACNSLNWYIFAEREDPGGMFAWLHSQLLEVEANGGVAVILAHYPPNYMQHQFGVRYRALMERFQHVVRFTYTGHTHRKYYNVAQSMTNPEKPIMWANIGPSVTPFKLNQPAFQRFDLDAETLLPLNVQTYYMDIAKANANDEPTWEILDDYIKDYGLTDLSPSSMKDLAERIKSDDELARTFYLNQFRGGTTDDTFDQLDLYCQVSTSEMHAREECYQSGGTANPTYGQSFPKNNPQYWADALVSNWIKVSKREDL